MWIFAPQSFAQTIQTTDFAPPPLKILTKDERTQLNAETDVKKRTRLTLELMEARIKQAEIFAGQNDYDAMFLQLGSFHGLMDNALDYLNGRNISRGKALDNLKRLEMALRKFRPRLELIRQDLSPRYEHYVYNLIKYVRDARTRAIEPLFGDTVVPRKNT